MKQLQLQFASFLIKIKTYCFLFGLIFVVFASSCKSSSPLFKSSSKKGPNIYSSKPPRTKSRSKLYSHSISKKKTKTKGSVFSSKKSRYKSVVSSPKGGKEKGKKESSGGRKSGKGRKK
jgi:hypothetical protein